jgi:superfamily II DNA or RNA helicase
MGLIPIRIAGEIEINISDLPQDIFEQVKAGLTFENEEKQKAAERHQFGFWDMPDVITLYKVEQRRGGDHVLLLPRGYAANLTAGLIDAGHTPIWEDHRVLAPAEPGYFRPFVMRDYQFDAATKLIQAQQGFYDAPAGSGKTWTALGVSAWLNQRTLVIVDKAGLLEQWRERAQHALGLKPDQIGKIGENVWEERDLTIALRQTLWSREWENKATRWFRTFGCVWFDEGHHLGAETLGEIARQVESRYMFAISATPAKSPTHGAVVHALVGPTVAQTTRQELYDREVLMRPTVERIETGFKANFWPDHDAEPDGSGGWKCQAEGCPKKGKHRHRNNYTSCLKKLVEDPERNVLIAREIVKDRGHVHLVPSRQLKHLDFIKKACIDAGWDGPIYFLRGEENARGESQLIAQAIQEGGKWGLVTDDRAPDLEPEWDQIEPPGEYGREAIIFSTVADEGLDIPPIDRNHIVFPMRQEAATIQLVGRGERVAPNKTDSIIKDYVDASEPFVGQSWERFRVYGGAGYKVRDVVIA